MPAKENSAKIDAPLSYVNLTRESSTSMLSKDILRTAFCAMSKCSDVAASEHYHSSYRLSYH